MLRYSKILLMVRDTKSTLCCVDSQVFHFLIEFAYHVGESVIVIEQDLKILGIWLLQQLLYLD